MNTFSIGEMLTFGWETFKKRPWFFVGAMALLFVIQMVLQAIGMVPFFGTIVSVVGGVFVGMGVIRLSLGAHDSVADVSLKVASSAVGFWRYLGAGFLKGIIAAGPVLVVGIVIAVSLASASNGSGLGWGAIVTVMVAAFFVVAWLFYASARLSLVEYFVLDAKKGPLEAVKGSFRATQYVVGKLVLFMFVIGLLNILGALALLVGLVVTVPVTILAMAHLYRTLCPTAPIASVPTPSAPASITPPPVTPAPTPVA